MANVRHFDIDGTTIDVIPSGNYVTGVKGNSETTYRTGNVNITKNNIGLGNVPNVTTNNQAPTFTQASTRANIASGETLTTILGKVMKWFADLKTVAFSGSYTDLSNKPTIPTVNNATLTIQKNGTNVQTFTANSSTNKTANITVPTKTSELTNDSGFITDAGVTGVKGNSETTYRTGNVNITKGNIGLGNVPNVTTNNQTPTFTQASTRANIASGETLTTILGKVMKWYADLKTVAFSGSYTDLSNKPTIPTVNNATLTIQKNGTNVQTFTANSSSNKTANITVPTKTSELTNDSNFISNPSDYAGDIIAPSGLATYGTCIRVGKIVMCSFTSGTAITNNMVIGTIPSGYRPAREIYCSGTGSITDSNLSTIPCYFKVATNGNITVVAPANRSFYYLTGFIVFIST